MADRDPPTPVDYESRWRTLRDFVRHHPGARHRRRLCWQLVRDLPFASAIDVGCGPGDFIELLRERRPGVRICGVDLAEPVLARNAARWPDVEFRPLDIERAALDERFELVSCLEVLEHLEDRGAALENLARMTAAGGHLLLSCPTGRLYPTERYFGHTTHPTAEELRQHARSAGLEVRALWCWGWPLYAALKWATNIDPQWAIDSFASGEYGWLQRQLSALLYLLNFFNLRSARGCQLFALLRRPPA